jgi:hypothetical protein
VRVNGFMSMYTWFRLSVMSPQPGNALMGPLTSDVILKPIVFGSMRCTTTAALKACCTLIRFDSQHHCDERCIVSLSHLPCAVSHPADVSQRTLLPCAAS